MFTATTKKIATFFTLVETANGSQPAHWAALRVCSILTRQELRRLLVHHAYSDDKAALIHAALEDARTLLPYGDNWPAALAQAARLVPLVLALLQAEPVEHYAYRLSA